MALDQLYAFVFDVHSDLCARWNRFHAHRPGLKWTLIFIEIWNNDFNPWKEGESELKECKKLDNQLTAAKVISFLVLQWLIRF